MTITTEDCKFFIKENSESPKHANAKWKRIRKYKEGKLILRDFSNSDGDILTICEDEFQNLSFYKKDTSGNTAESKPGKTKSNWLRLLTEHFSDPCYAEDNYTPEKMLNEYLTAIQHGMQHEEYTTEDIYFQTKSSVTYLVAPNSTTSDEENILIDVEELKKFGYTPKPNQSGYDFVDENWNWY